MRDACQIHALISAAASFVRSRLPAATPGAYVSRDPPPTPTPPTSIIAWEGTLQGALGPQPDLLANSSVTAQSSIWGFTTGAFQTAYGLMPANEAGSKHHGGCLGILGDRYGSVETLRRGECPRGTHVIVPVCRTGQVASNVEAVSLSEDL